MIVLSAFTKRYKRLFSLDKSNNNAAKKQKKKIVVPFRKKNLSRRYTQEGKMQLTIPKFVHNLRGIMRVLELNK